MMNWKVGDRVKFLNDTGGGRISRIISNDMVHVLNEDGFEIPVAADEILKIEEEDSATDNYIPAEEKVEAGMGSDVFDLDIPEQAEIQISEDPTGHIWLAIVPLDQQNPAANDMEVYLVNDSDYSMFYVILLKRGAGFVNFASGVLEDNTKLYIAAIPRERLNEIRHFRLQLLFFRNGFYPPVPPTDMTINLQPHKFFKSSVFRENDFFEERAFLINSHTENEPESKMPDITDEEISRAIREKERTHRQSPENRRKDGQEETEVVDLHIHELVENSEGLSNKEMLDIQMGRFQIALEGAVRDPSVKRVVMIHGVGNGRLRYEIRKHLDRRYPKLDYQDASFEEYGYGATLIFLRK